jgi:hypothetical protein
MKYQSLFTEDYEERPAGENGCSTAVRLAQLARQRVDIAAVRQHRGRLGASLNLEQQLLTESLWRMRRHSVTLLVQYLQLEEFRL